MSFPKIIYPSGGGTTLAFVDPPTQYPAYWIKATRHDNFSEAGVRESIVENLQNFIDLNMEWVVSGADVSQWNTFLTTCAMLGLLFDYYPDASVGSFSTYRLKGEPMKLDWKSVGMFKFKAIFRLKV